ncbi:CsbD family protein [Gluconobacter wancherniae]|uniref:CsbD-like domain-containing protein n=1 Tax=Gluconobacter wancherniae NBRC 103581 TaxID=656744 RepID=A0A511B8Z4_9PROT|nr:CsbD family protein [Gluconobacter wancherniae]MBF0853901.1 CsbD family protein [Gluconobacter wancherniae]MBS1062287.1 CsbD family protein [Gluconobacter wancherniae]MBS1089161.1 CsbD family protein [Gluconobacter wancherniae]MBS1094329.1 CsbD family protein [Gluconobacter wancherniae]MBS1094582.1 CsbD family protein [Gluconobacter wancherniae]
MSSIEDKIKGAANQVAGKIKENIGRATDNPTLEGEGVAQNLKGKAQETKGDVKDAVKSSIDKI